MNIYATDRRLTLFIAIVSFYFERPKMI